MKGSFKGVLGGFHNIRRLKSCSGVGSIPSSDMGSFLN